MCTSVIIAARTINKVTSNGFVHQCFIARNKTLMRNTGANNRLRESRLPRTSLDVKGENQFSSSLSFNSLIGSAKSEAKASPTRTTFSARIRRGHSRQSVLSRDPLSKRARCPPKSKSNSPEKI